MPLDSNFRRNFFVIAGLHVAAVAIIYFASGWHHKSSEEKVVWLDGGSMGGGGAQASEAAPEAPSVTESAPKPSRSKFELPPEPLSYPAPGELVLPKKATPKARTPKQTTPRPTPRHFTPKPTPKHNPKPKPNPEETSEESTPKPKPVVSEKPANTPEAKKHETAKAESPKPENTAGAIRTASVSHTPGASTSSSPGAGKGTGTGDAPGKGNGKGPGKSGSGSGASEFGWYFSMIHDRFHSRWDQPTTIPHESQEIVTTLKIRISKDGNILSREIVHTSGDATMDQSVMTAAERVQEIDPLPAGLGNGEFYEVNIAFKLDQSE
ncbi:MAG TPA: TonB family protein [Chthoniobacter sp.]|jgi:TonB family protein